MPDSPAWRAAIIGAGAIAQACHAPGYHRDPRTALVAFADPVLDRHDEMLAAYPEAEAYADFHEMLAEVRPDIVSVCTPNVHHCAATLAALEAGCDVLCEKPMALTLEETKRMIRAAERADAKLMIGFTHRLFRGPQRAKQLLDENAIGDPFMMRVRFAHGGPYPGWAKDDWFYKPVQSGGGALLDMGIHAIDLCHWLLGPITAVQARVATLVKNIGVEDNALLLVEFGASALGYIECGWSSKPGFSGFEIYGTDGTLICDYREGLKLLRGDASAGKNSTTEWEVVEAAPLVGGWDVEIEHWLDVIEEKTPLTMDGAAGQRAVAVALAAYQSHQRSRRMEVH